MVVDVSESKYLIGEINFDEPINEYSIEPEQRSPSIKKLGPCTVEVYDREGMIPHMHVISKEKIFCICLHTNKYFSHEDKFSQFSSTKQKEDLNEWLKKPNIKVAKDYHLSGITNYDAAVYMWNKMNPNAILVNNGQPDYSTMFEEIQKNK